MNKICVYAICKNEKQFIEKWLQSMSEADYIVVLDTGSTDGTFEELKRDKRITRVEQKIINPWRFDVARNESLKLVPEDANILLCTDLDEVLDAGWAEVVKDNWIENYHVRGWYKYAWSHLENGSPGRIFYYDKLHDRNWKWKYPVHELLVSDYSEEYEKYHTLDLFDKGVYLHHYPDLAKSRSSYLPLLKLRAKEDPNDYYGHYYLAHELYYRQMYNESITLLYQILSKFKDRMTQVEKAACYLFIGDSYTALEDYDKAINSYLKAVHSDPSYREPYLALAEMFNFKGQYHVAIGFINEAEQKTYRHYTWLERDNSWEEKIDDILSISYFYIGNIEKSYEHVKKAYKINPCNFRIIENKKIIEKTL